MTVTSNLEFPTPDSAKAMVTVGVRIPMRDGLSLHAVTWRPRGQSAPVPVVMELTPYGVDHLHPDGVFWANNGFAYVAIDVRGRGNSDGDFVPFMRDAADGYDAVEWLAAQEWCDGRVALHGGSYTGINQYLIMAAAPPSLRAITPDSTSGHGIDLPRGGIPMLYEFGWRRLVSNRATHFTISGDQANWHQQLYDALAAGTSLVEAAAAAGAPLDEDSLAFVDQPEPGPYSERFLAQPEQFAASAVPVLSITGMYDDSSGGTLRNWRRFAANASAEVVGRSHLVVGPWDHMGSHFGPGRVGELVFGPAATVDLPALRRDWLRHVLDGAPLPELLRDRVMLYVTGSERWVGAPSLEAASTGVAERWLRSVDGPMDALHSGFVDEAAGDGPTATFTCDPLDLRTAQLELQRRPDGSGPESEFHGEPMNAFMHTVAGNDPTNARFVLEIDGQGLVYISRPLAEDLVVVGEPELHLHVVCDQPDADLAVLVHEVTPAGDSIFLSSDLLRLSCRNYDGGHEWLVPGEPTPVAFSHFKWCQRRVRAGSRLRVAIRYASSIQLTGFPHGRPADAAAAHVQVLHDAAHAPRLVLPLGGEGGAMADGVHDQLSPTARWLAHPFPVHADVASDGGLVAVTTTCIPPGAAEAQQQIVLLDVAGGDPRPLPAALPGDHTATWSPDGQRVAFITMRSGAAQVAVCAADATEPAVVISVPGPATGPVSWSPDGSRVAFTAGRGRTVDRTLPWRTTREVFWFDAVGHLDDAPQVWVADTGSGEATMVTDDEWWWSAPRWSPDGERIAAMVGFDPDERRFGQQLRILEPDATVSTPAVPAGFTAVAVWAPDGSLMVLTRRPDGPLLDGDEQLHRVFPDGTVRRVEAPMQIGGSVYGDSPALIDEVLESAIAISGTDLFVRTHRGGRMGVARHSLTDGTWDEMVAGARAVSPLAMTGRGLVVAEQSAAMPCRISVIETGSDSATWGVPLSLIGEHEVPPVAEVLRFTVPSPHQGDLLEGWHLRPVDVEGPLPTVLLIHGGPGAAFGEMLNIDAQALCAAGFGVVYTNPHGSTGYGESFAAANIGNWGDLPTADVFAVIDEAIARGWVDPDRLGVAGLSYGGYLTCWLACTTDRFRAAVAENPVTNLVSLFGTSDVGRFFLARSLGADLLDDMGPYVRQSPLFHAARCHTPLLFVVGERDHRCPPTQSFELHSVLRSLGRTSELLMLPDSFHAGSMLGAPAVRLAQDEALVEWMERWLLDVEGEPERS